MMHRIEPFRIIPLEQAGTPDGMRGCGKCKFGLINPPPVNVAASLYSVRTVQAGLQMLTFCTCPAGQAYRRHLRGEYRAVHDGDYAKSPAYYDKVTAAVKSPARVAPEPEPEPEPEMSQAEIDAALRDLGEVHVPTINGVDYAHA